MSEKEIQELKERNSVYDKAHMMHANKIDHIISLLGEFFQRLEDNEDLGNLGYDMLQKILDEEKNTSFYEFHNLKVWCTKCDKVMKNKGIALDSPRDGIFYVCSGCNYRIIIFPEV